MLHERGRRTLSSAGHSCNDDCMLSSDDETSRTYGHPLRQNPPSIYDEHYENIILAPSPALTSDHSTCYSPEPPSPIEDVPPIPTRNGHQRSWTSSFKLPPVVAQTASRASLASPTKTLSSFISSRTSTPEDGHRSPSRQRSNILGDWFVGTSAPIQLGIPSPKRELSASTFTPDDYLSGSEMTETYTNRPTKARRSSTATSSPAGSGLTSKLSWLAKSITTTTTSSPIRPGTALSDPFDELLDLNINHALLPHGTPDILAPSSFHDLLSSAEVLLLRYQSAYRQKCAALSEQNAEQSAQAEELEEAETRARHLKMQLDGMAEKAKEQEEAMRALSLELLAERRRREDENLARQKSLKLVRRQDRSRDILGGGTGGSDSGFESDSDSALDSVSVGGSFHSSPTLADGDDYPGMPRPVAKRRPSTYDHVLKTVAGEPASAWAIMDGYREENRMLRTRVEELEGAVEGCLDMVAGLGI